MEVKIEKVWGKVRNDRFGVVVTIENRDQVFKWLPTYKQLSHIYSLLSEVEEINKGLDGGK